MEDVGYKTYCEYTSVESVPQFRDLPSEVKVATSVASCVLPFKTNSYIVEQLIDWSRIPDDPIFQVNFPQPGMMIEGDVVKVRDLLDAGASPMELWKAITRARSHLLPQKKEDENETVPTLDATPVPGISHQYAETILVFPSAAVNCFAVCTYCYRWPKHLGLGTGACYSGCDVLVDYLRNHPEVSDIQFTGGDPMMMDAKNLEQTIAPLLRIESLESIRFSTRAISWWPYRFTTDDDADTMLKVFEMIVNARKHCAIMAHITHARELSTKVAEEAVSRIRSTGAIVRSQSPLLCNVNADAGVLTDLLRQQVRLGIVPYYLFLDSDPGPRQYFKIPFDQAIRLVQDAKSNLSGLARTLQGPVVYTARYKVLLVGIVEFDGRAFLLYNYLRSMEVDLTGRTFCVPLDRAINRFDQLDLHCDAAVALPDESGAVSLFG